MRFRDDPRLAEAQAKPILKVVARLDIQGLRRASGELVGPCPVCGGHDRFGVNIQRGVFNCRRSEVGGDAIRLVEHVLAVDFKSALSWLCGERDLQLDPVEAERRRRVADAKRRKADDFARHKRREAINDARRIWQECVPAAGTSVQDYLARRGIELTKLEKMPVALRCHPELPYMVKSDTGWQSIHRGPAMVAAIQAPGRKLTAVHRTWLDLSQPKAKALITHQGEAMQAKKVLGSKKGGAIRLTQHQSGTMVMGEGIETTLTAMIANVFPGAAYWCGVDLGNMAGRRKLGQGLKYAGLPDMGDTDAWLPPPWVKRLVFIQDGDSDARLTRAKLESGLRRAMATIPDLNGQIVHAGEGQDLNDVLMEGLA